MRDVTRREKDGSDGYMCHRWCVAGLLRAEAGFGKVKVDRQLATLRQALKSIILDNQDQAA